MVRLQPSVPNWPEMVGPGPPKTVPDYSVAGTATSRKYGSTFPLSFTVIG